MNTKILKDGVIKKRSIAHPEVFEFCHCRSVIFALVIPGKGFSQVVSEVGVDCFDYSGAKNVRLWRIYCAVDNPAPSTCAHKCAVERLIRTTWELVDIVGELRGWTRLHRTSGVDYTPRHAQTSHALHYILYWITKNEHINEGVVRGVNQLSDCLDSVQVQEWKNIGFVQDSLLTSTPPVAHHREIPLVS
jgi:hypothetical protein